MVMGNCKKGPAKWLLGELPQLQQEGVIDAASAGNLREYYTRLLDAPGQGRTLAVLMLSVLGSLLIGAGVITLLAHNWDELPKWLRLAVAFLPLLIAQGIGGWALLKDKSLAWRESVGMFTPLAVMAVISIVAQVYNISGDPVKFYFTLCMLSIPVVYIYRSTMAALLCMAGICALGAFSFEHSDRPDANLLKYWTCVLLLVPFVVFMFRRHGQTMRSFWLAIGCAVLLIWQAGFAVCRLDSHNMPIFGILASVVWLLGRSSDENRWALAFKTLAMPGLLIVFIVSSYKWAWDSIHIFGTFMYLPVWWYGFVGLLMAANLLLLVRMARSHEWLTFMPGMSGLLLLIGMIACNLCGAHEISGLIANIIGFFGGVAVMLLAIRQEKIIEMNFGMLLAALIIVFRFFDSEYSFTVKGVAFILVGVLFLAINWMMFRKFRRAVK